ncbi:mucoidy inhibitor MuiA family protein [Labrys sp. ZIDIC5]|uniref:mucoidy inhibitor MuiA family protein n=1 Tax=Labrys sedimenti TaxID=3106036 RepID=UPI002ACA7D4D|nr:mucoidy inhibitor MuiA family protein [Labrys sp. ZIDIC5]MDZ5452443.1 mucoidy inhibitor MuiA family protein [Labrys sp. ZIDIC5]
MSPVPRLALTALLLLGTAPVFAGDLGVQSKIDAVSVYPDGATVTRVIEFDIPAGESVLVAKDLPSGLDAASIRVDMREAAGVSLAGTDIANALSDGPVPDAAASKSLQDLKDQREGLAGIGKALLAKRGLIERFANGATFNAAKEGSNVAALRGAWNAVGDDMIEVNEALRQNALKIRDLDEDIARLQSQRDGRPEGQKRTQLRLSVNAEQAIKGRIAISYLIGNAGWTPLYDARLDSEKGELELVRRAKVTQATGEDWSDVALTISTARATTGAAPPKLVSYVLNFQPDYDVLPADALARSRAEENEARQAPQATQAAPAKPRPGREVEAQLNTAGYQSVWALPARASVPSGPGSKALRLASATLTPDIVARAVPSLQQTAFLEASFSNGEDTPLFPGSVSIYRDGLYAGQTAMPLATKGEPVRLGFGADDRIKVERAVTRKVESNIGIARPTTSERRDYKISLRNGRATAIKLSIEEALPVAENKDIKVEPSAQMTPPTQRDADNRRGVLVWTVDLAPGAAKDINFGYKVTWPGAETINLD